ncbi:MAG: hypothetical protein A2X12_10465 [Bacteroidetes bacterium GWE2_29_8]|nr:MAG: hypothetical protein A2X12_10465 [Bacteroidetes bacterium GWE2_29_8]OFY21046.1 MAG: hypothetical protein A2X02_07275 [Bacteroidetes bacterium GWF2_29_10]
MEELNAKQIKFLKKWVTHKWLYIFYNTLILLLQLLIFTVIYVKIYNIENLKSLNFLDLFYTFIIPGIGVVFLNFKNMERQYLNWKNEVEIKKGLKILKEKGVWSYENIKISKTSEELLVVQNELFWIDGNDTISSDKLDEFYNSVFADFKRLKRYKSFANYIKNKSIKIQIFDNLEGNTPLLEKMI